MNNIKVINIPADKNVYVVGDIHGCYDLLIEELTKHNFDYENDLCISVGDFGVKYV